MSNIIAIASGKGGVGKSTVAAGIASALSQSGARVGILDADIYGPSIPLLFGVENAMVEMDFVDGKELMRPVYAEGIKLFSIGFLSKPNEAIVWRGPMVSQAVKQFMNGVNWGNLDYLIVDLPPGTGDVQITISQNIPLSGVIVVSTPQKLAVADARRACAMFQMNSIRVPLLGLIENMAWFETKDLPGKKYPIFGVGGVEKLETEFETEILGKIPIQTDLVQGDATQTLFHKGNIEFFSDIAGRLVRQLAVQHLNLQTV